MSRELASWLDLLEMEALRSSNVDALSPVQCPPYLPLPGNVDRDIIKLRLPLNSRQTLHKTVHTLT